MCSIKGCAITYGLRKANYKDVREHQQVIQAYCCEKDVFFFCFCTLTAREDTREKERK